MKFTAIAALLLLASFADAGPPRVPVVVELFTSEGCSSCPAADRLLAKYATEQPFPGVEVLPLAFHVDYWDYLGWKDAQASAENTGRQRRYATRLSGDRVYTPQMVVDGRSECVGSDARESAKLIADAGAGTHVPIHVEWLPTLKAGELRLRVTAAPPAGSKVWVALTESGIVRQVGGGENSGRRLEHLGVVRELRVVEMHGGAAAEVVVPLSATWKAANLSAVAFVQDAKNLRMLGAARTEASAPAKK